MKGIFAGIRKHKQHKQESGVVARYYVLSGRYVASLALLALWGFGAGDSQHGRRFCAGDQG